MNSGWTTLGVLILLFFIVFGGWGMATKIEKANCEATLPRNVECVWAAPEKDNE